MPVYLDDRSPVTVCPVCRLEVAPSDLEVAKDGKLKCGRCAMEPWEHVLEDLYRALNDVSAAARTSESAWARKIHRQLTQLEADLMAVTQIAAQRMEE